LEVFFSFLNPKKYVKKSVESSSDKTEMLDSVIGYRFVPNLISSRKTKVVGVDTIFDVYYSSDEYSRRINSDNILENESKATKHSIFLGGSFTWGHGLKYDSTFPHLFEKFSEEYKSYNYGYAGYGPHQFPFLFERGLNLINNHSIAEDDGFCMYTFITDHLNRVYGSSDYLSWGAMTPDVYINDDGELYSNERSLLGFKVYSFLNESETLKYFKITLRFSYPIKTNFYKRFADIINYTARSYWKVKPKGDFIVAIYPYPVPPYIQSDVSWLKFLDERIRVVDVKAPNDFSSNNPYYLIKNDSHPTKELNLHFTKQILLFLNSDYGDSEDISE